MSNKKKKVTAVAAIATAAALLLGGTFAWQSISQTALNETDDIINPGGRLHDDFDGSNKDVYVENFADNPIFARIRLDEYFEITMNKNTPAEATEVITTGATKGDTDTYLTHYFDQENLTDTYWEWATGGSTTYMPTFNKNKDSLKADINGTYDMDFDDYVAYTDGETKIDNAVYDADSNSVEDENVTTVEETHYATTTINGDLMSMQEWIDAGSTAGDYWVYDTDGWVYWANAIQPNTATGLLLDGISLKDKMDDSYYYAINVTAQFVTADDVGKDDNTGFYDTTAGTVPSADAENLLRAIGVDMGEEPTTEPITEPLPTGDTVYSVYTTNADGDYDMILFSSADNITKAQAAAIAGISEDAVAFYSDMNMTFSNGEELTIDEDKAMSIIENNMKVSSVSFANEVKPTNMNYYFGFVGENVSKAPTFDFTNLDTSSVTSMESTFGNCTATELDVSSFDTSNVTNMSSMFSKMKEMTSLTLGDNWDTSKVTDMNNMFRYCQKLTEFDLSDFDTSKVTDMSGMFHYCDGLTDLNVSSFNTSNVTDMNRMFADCKNLTSLNLTSFDTSKVTDMSYLFGGAGKISDLDLSSFDTSNVTNMSNMFNCCEGLTDLDVASFNTSKATDMSDMFANCKNLISLNLTSLDTSGVTNMSMMFANCKNLTSLDLTSFDTSRVTDMYYMFSEMSNLTSITLGNQWETASVTTMRGMFYSTKNLSLDCSEWDISIVGDYEYFDEYEDYSSGSLEYKDIEGIIEPAWLNE